MIGSKVATMSVELVCSQQKECDYGAYPVQFCSNKAKFIQRHNFFCYKEKEKKGEIILSQKVFQSIFLTTFFLNYFFFFSSFFYIKRFQQQRLSQKYFCHQNLLVTFFCNSSCFLLDLYGLIFVIIFELKICCHFFLQDIYFK